MGGMPTASDDSSVTVGIDMSADPNGTAIATVTWGPDSAHLSGLHVGADDDLVRHHLHLPGGPVGIDCPLGWPDAFVDYINAHHAQALAVDPYRAPGWRRPLTNRHTDLFVHSTTGIAPLSVAADRIAQAALRLAALLSELAPNVNQARDGSGDLVEVYPAAALSQWGLPFTGYKTARNRPVLSELVDALLDIVPWLALGSWESACRRSDDAFDALLCALVARAARHGATLSPTGNDAEAARREGWIHLPSGPLPHRPWGLPRSGHPGPSQSTKRPGGSRVREWGPQDFRRQGPELSSEARSGLSTKVPDQQERGCAGARSPPSARSFPTSMR